MTIDNLRRRALALRLSQKELAARAGVDQMSVHRLFHGTTDPRLSTVSKIEAAITKVEGEMRQVLGAGPAAS